MAYGIAGSRLWGWTAAGSALLLLLTFLVLCLADRWSVGKLLLFFYAGLLWGCWVGVGFAFSPPEPTHVTLTPSASVPDAVRLHVPVRIVYDGKVLATLTGPREYSVDVPDYQERLLTVEVLRPEGWRPCNLSNSSRSVWFDPGPFLTLYVDNRGNGPVTLGCGELRLPVRAGEHGPRTIAAPLDADGVAVTIDGREVGKLKGTACLVDVRGTRTYQLRHLQYVGPGTLPDFIRDRPPAPKEGETPRPDLTLSRRHVHALEEAVDFFLTPAPEEIEVMTVRGFPTGTHKRTELLEFEGQP